MTVLAFHNWLRRAERNKRNPKDMKERPGGARAKSRILAAIWALLHTGRPVVVAHYLAGTEENNHAFPSRIEHRELRTVKAVGS